MKRMRANSGEPAFKTERLLVYATECNLTPYDGWELHVFFAFPPCEIDEVNRPRVTCVCSHEPVVVWIQTERYFKREGYALDLLDGIAAYLNLDLPLIGDHYLTRAAEKLFEKHKLNFRRNQ